MKKYKKIGYKLKLSYFLFVTIPVLVIGAFAYITFVQSLKEQTRRIITEVLYQMKENIEYKLEDNERISDMIYYDNTLFEFLRNYQYDWDSLDSTITNIIPRLQSTISATKSNIWLSLYVDNEMVPEIYNTISTQVDPLNNKKRIFEIYQTERIADKGWYLSLPPEEYGVTKLWMQVENDQEFGNISLIRRLVDPYYGAQSRIVGSIKITMKIDELFQSIEYHKLGEGSSVIILDDQQTIKYAYSTNEVPLPTQWDESLLTNNLIIEEKIPGLNWRMIALIPNHVFLEEANKVRDVTVLICLISVVILYIASALTSNYFSKRVTKIVSVLSAFQEGNFTKRMNYRGNDEFSLIASALNELGSDMTQLIDRVYVTNLQKKEAELESLQAQINPHFLYNTLSTISRMAKLGEIGKLERMVLKMAQFYRLSLNKGKVTTTVEKELQHVRTYLEIQGIKYSNRMSVNYDIDTQILEYSTVKLILQPFAENILEHAWLGDRINIRIMAYQKDSTVVFKVIDDGIGMRRELIPQLLSTQDEAAIGYGIRNVDQRIKLHYGPEYGVELFSRVGIGTTITITIPSVL